MFEVLKGKGYEEESCNFIEEKATAYKVKVHNLSSAAELRLLSDSVANGCVIVVNMTQYSDIPYALAYLEGALYALRGTIKNVAFNTYILLPKGTSFNGPSGLDEDFSDDYLTNLKL